jgi:hypothetical protein
MAAKRQITAEGETPQVSSNFDGMKRRVNPPLLATAKATADGSPDQGTAATTIPSNDDDEDEPLGEAALTTTTRKPR